MERWLPSWGEGGGVADAMARTAIELGVDTTIDAAGKYVLPGGVDVHTHMELPFGGTYASDTFESGTRAAAFGGTTTIVDFAVQTIGEPMMDGYEAWMAKADGNAPSTTGST